MRPPAFHVRTFAAVATARRAIGRRCPGMSVVLMVFAILLQPVVHAQPRSPTAPAQASTATTAATPAQSPSVLSRFASPSDQFSLEPKEQIQLDITVTAAIDVNVDDKGRATPILVRIYELKSEAAFETADYFSLQNGDKAVIGSDMLTREEFILRPGDVKTIRRKSHPEVGAIAVLAGYRDLAQSDWRAVHKLPPAPEVAWYRAVLPAHKAHLQIQLLGKGIRITPIK